MKTLAFVLLVAALAGCNGTPSPTYILADQARKDAVFGAAGPITSHLEKYPDQAQTWQDFGAAWQRNIDANSTAAAPWWMFWSKPSTTPEPVPPPAQLPAPR